MKDMGQNYQNTTQLLIESFEDTMQKIQKINREFQRNIQKMVNTANDENQRHLQTSREQFNDLITQIEDRNSQLQSIRRKCETVTSVVSIFNPANWFRRRKKSCFGYQIPNVCTKCVTNITVGDSNVQDTLGDILDATDPNGNGKNFTLAGNTKRFNFLIPVILYNHIKSW